MDGNTPQDFKESNPSKDTLENSSDTRSGDSNLDSSEQSVRKRVRQRTPSPHSSSSSWSSSPRYVSVEELLETAKGVTNMALAHEIVLNGGFQLKRSEPVGSLEKRVREIVHKAFWDSLETQLSENPPTYDHAIKLLGEIKETLLSFLLPGHNRLRNQINEVLDLELIKQEAENGALGINKVAEFIIDMMGTLCAPARDEEVGRLRNITSVVPLFKEIFSVLDLMKIDMANFAISSIRPHLMQQSIEYERMKFQEFIEKQPNALDCTQKWIEEALNDLISSEVETTSSASRAENVLPAVSSSAVLNWAYLKLLKWDHLKTPFPETLLMDETRFQEMQLQLDQLTLIVAILLITYNIAGTELSGLPGFAEKLKEILKVLLTGMHMPCFNVREALVTSAEKICLEVNTCLNQHGFSHLSPDREAALKGQIEALMKTDNSIHKLIGSRIQSFLKCYIEASCQKSSPVPGGLEPVRMELVEIAVKFSRLVNYNKMVFSPYYDRILSVLIKSKHPVFSLRKSVE
ncbi:T-complex protein 11-like protein 1 [Erpetoichthys calabaricus]|uniref:T-complex 11, testis-specific-like 1 n=1 Tax=Erpetoichthys calabaricus TaxID=27687 RepID=A0A8C4RY01_ERPCA|nr:T-complex protein 11-like protein 1 [Erpetoichthys calabaricus]XP_028649718.1 T-complex protein 11-like protein 1 [Erpetoichthys calabaricus]XP_028649720.1 T-complex protein 11-like protein 1 [Erpetoichthys calabaricus]